MAEPDYLLELLEHEIKLREAVEDAKVRCDMAWKEWQKKRRNKVLRNIYRVSQDQYIAALKEFSAYVISTPPVVRLLPAGGLPVIKRTTQENTE